MAEQGLEVQVRTFVVFSDIDATLIDHSSYQLGPSLGAVRLLQRLKIPLVLCSSKTRLEQQKLRHELSITDPYVVENGSAVLDLPDAWLEGGELLLGAPLSVILNEIQAACVEVDVVAVGFSTVPVAELASQTGLSPAAAMLAKSREYSETLISVHPEARLQLFRAFLEERGLAVHQGGRYLSVVGSCASKGSAVKRVTDLYRQSNNDVVTVGIGDASNDIPMLAEVDLPFLVRRPDKTWTSCALSGVTRLDGVGPEGFAQMVESLVAQQAGQ